jgi:hypothetical protein
MTFRSATIRWMTWACACALVLLVSRNAGAAAPICDERGASAIAPPPVRQARDVRIDAGFPLGCEVPLPTRRAAFGPRGGGQPQPVVTDGGFDDTWVRPSVPRLPKRVAEQAPDASTTTLPASAGFGRDVFRPPRA